MRWQDEYRLVEKHREQDDYAAAARHARNVLAWFEENGIALSLYHLGDEDFETPNAIICCQMTISTAEALQRRKNGSA